MDSQLRTDRVRVREVVDRLQAGTLVVPEFQRGYVWKPSRASKLVDSLYRKYPVGCLLAWETTEAVTARSASRRSSGPALGATAQFLIDGQQRTRTLERIMTAGDEDSLDVYFHTIDGTFKRGSATVRRDPVWVRLTELWSDAWHQLVADLCEEHPDHAGALRRNVEQARAILDYEIPLVVMRGHSFQEAVEAFERINTLGVRLKLEDLQSAELAARHIGFIRGRVIPMLASLREQGLDRITTSQLYKVVAALARPEARKRPGLDQLDKRELDLGWQRMERGLELLQAMMREELGVRNMSLIWSGALMVPALVMLGHHKPGVRETRRLAGWMGTAALHHRYRGSTESAMDQDVSAALRAAPVDGLLRNLKRSVERRRLQGEPEDFSAAHVLDRGAMFAAYLASRQREARDIFSGKLLSGLGPREELRRLHIFPRASFPPEERREADYVVNVAFALPDTAVAVGKARASEYLPNLKARDLKSQCIPVESALWESYEHFCEARAQDLAEAFNEFLAHCGVL